MTYVKSHSRVSKKGKIHNVSMHERRARIGGYFVVGVDEGIRKNFGVSTLLMTKQEIIKSVKRSKNALLKKEERVISSDPKINDIILDINGTRGIVIEVNKVDNYMIVDFGEGWGKDRLDLSDDYFEIIKKVKK